MKKRILDSISRPEDIKKLSIEELESLAEEIRAEIISTVQSIGGHLASSLGVVDLTLALYKVFDFSKDKLVWDVGHQAYAHKIITRGIEKFRTLRQFGGLSGFPKMDESPYDHFGVGHSSTSISACLGMAVARDILNQNHKVIAVIGDGSMTAGMAYEALNHAGDLEKDLIVILNDNEMSISKNVGALSSFLSRKLAHKRFVKFKQDLKRWLKQVPKFGEEILNYARKSEESLKNLFTPGILFEIFRFYYIGPIDGHNIKKMVQYFSEIKELNKPVLVHVLTKKGKGYPPAEKDPTLYHGVGKFKPNKQDKDKGPSIPTYSHVFGDVLCKLAEKDKKIIAITAAMPEGTGLVKFREMFPKRFFDVGICEQHAVTFAAGLATQGFKPVVAIYSTFLQRAFDQIIHDVCLQNLHVIFCLDRAGLVGEDGPTHHGSFDLSYLRLIPNMTIMAPKDEVELQNMIYTAINFNGPIAIRYPRGKVMGVDRSDEFKNIEIGEGEIVRQGNDLIIAAIGNMVYPSIDAANIVYDLHNIDCCVLNLRFAKPISQNTINLIGQFDKILVVEENTIFGGVSSYILELLCDHWKIKDKNILRIGIPDRFIEHGKPHELRKMLGLCEEGIVEGILKLIGKE